METVGNLCVLRLINHIGNDKQMKHQLAAELWAWMMNFNLISYCPSTPTIHVEFQRGSFLRWSFKVAWDLQPSQNFVEKHTQQKTVPRNNFKTNLHLIKIQSPFRLPRVLGHFFGSWRISCKFASLHALKLTGFFFFFFNGYLYSFLMMKISRPIWQFG